MSPFHLLLLCVCESTLDPLDDLLQALSYLPCDFRELMVVYRLHRGDGINGWPSSAFDFIAQTHRLHGACDYLSTDTMLSILPPFAMCTAFPYSDYYGGSATPAVPRRTALLSITARASRLHWITRCKTT